MKQKLLKRTVLLLCALVAGMSSVWAADVTLKAGTNGSACTVNEKDGIKVGTSSKGGDMTITVPANTTTLTLHAAAWKGVTGLSLDISGATVSPASISLTADDGISNNSPFTLSGNENDFEFSITLSDVTTETEIKFTSSTTKRFVVWDASATVSSGGGGDNPNLTASDLALTGDPVALSFDLYSNATPQVINYTTSSTGTVTVASSEYISAAVDADNKTITVTPLKKTASTQTITVNQAADVTYDSGSATFTIDIDDSTPATYYDKVTDASTLNSGDELLIVCESQNVVMGASGNNIFTYVNLTPANGVISVTSEDVNVITLGGISGAWTFHEALGGKYLALTSSSNALHIGGKAARV